MPGVVSYVCHKDVPGKNVTGAVEKDEEIFATDKVILSFAFILSLQMYKSYLISLKNWF